MSCPNQGYSFINWTKDGEEISTDSVYSFSVTEDALYVANFSLNEYEITAVVDAEDNGMVSGGGIFHYGDNCTLTATASEGFSFINWTRDGNIVSESETFSFIVTESANYVANFALNSYDVSAVANPPTGGVIVFEDEEPQIVYSHIYDVGQLVVGSKVILAAQYDGIPQNYLAISNTITSGKLNTTAFISNQLGYVEFLPDDITAIEEDYYWTLGITEEGYTFTNANGDMIGYNTTTYFNMNGEKTAWSITTGNSDSISLVPYHFGFNIVNSVNENRAFAVRHVNDSYVCGAYSTSNMANTDYNFYLDIFTRIDAVAAPTFTPAGGLFYEAQEVAINCATEDAVIFYSLDSETGPWTAYTAPILVETDTTIWAYAEKEGYNDSPVTIAEYIIQDNQVVVFNQDWEGEMDGWSFVDVDGEAALWCIATIVSNNNHCATADGYNHGANVDWCISPSFCLNDYTNAVLSFKTAKNYSGNNLEVYFSNDYDGTDPTTATWTALTCDLSTGSWNWTESGDIDLSDFSGSDCHIGFKYTCTATSAAAWNVDDILLLAQVNQTNRDRSYNTYSHGDVATLRAIPNQGYTFVNWMENGEEVSTEPVYSFTVTSDRNLEANFALVYTVSATINPANAGTVSGTGTYVAGSTCILTATANEGYTFNNWTINGNVISTNPTYGFIVNSDRTVVANFSPFTIEALANPEEGGMVSGFGTYDYGATATLTATPNEGYFFVNWTKDNEVVSTETAYNFTVTNGGTYIANFGLNSYDITSTANPAEGGTVTGAGTYDHFEMATLTATANTGYHFSNWTKDGEIVSTEANYSFIVTEAGDYVANFVLNTYVITATADPTEGGTVAGEGFYEHGSTAVLTATAAEGYTFLNWTLNEQLISEMATFIFQVTNSADYVAHFELSTITQTTNFNNGWNWWSSYIELGDNSLEALQSGLGTSGEMIKSQNDGYASYLDGFGWYGSLTAINNESTYQVKTNAACNVELMGNETDPENHPITLNSGWTWVGYPMAVSMGVEEALAGIEPLSGDMLKSQNNGYASYLDGFGWYGSLSILNPGMGLMYKSNNSSPITLVYPNSGTRTDLKANQTADNNHWQPNLNAYPDNMSVMAVVELDGEELALRQAQGLDNYELAVFANGEVRGSARLLYVEPLDRYMAFLTVAGDEPAELHFGLYNTEIGEVEAQCITSLQYETNAIIGSFAEPYIVRFRHNTGLDEWDNFVNLFPNPVARGQRVSLGLPAEETGEVRVEIINALGTVVETRRATSLQTITAPSMVGVYTLRISIEGKGICYRKLVVR